MCALGVIVGVVYPPRQQQTLLSLVLRDKKMGRISLDFFRRKSHDEGGRPSGGTEKELPGYLKVMHDVPTSDSKRDLGLMMNHKKDRAIMDDAREEVPVVKKEDERDEERRTQPRRKSAELERKDSANVRKVQVL